MNNKYSAGLVSQSFWFIEMKKLISLIKEGKTENEIKKICIEDNMFGAPNEYRARRIFGYLWARTKNMDFQLIDIFTKSDLSTQKIINLVSILNGDRLFLEFLFEVYREKCILGSAELSNTDVNIFFNGKETQSDDVAAWKDRTKKRLCNIYINFLLESNLLTKVGNKKTITPPVLDSELVRYLESTGNNMIIKAITGEA